MGILVAHLYVRGLVLIMSLPTHCTLDPQDSRVHVTAAITHFDHPSQGDLRSENHQAGKTGSFRKCFWFVPLRKKPVSFSSRI